MKKQHLRHPSTGLHRCGYPKCDTVITTARFLCLIHWQALSGDLKRKLNAAFQVYLKGHEDGLEQLRQVQAECLLHLIGEWDRRQES